MPRHGKPRRKVFNRRTFGRLVAGAAIVPTLGVPTPVRDADSRRFSEPKGKGEPRIPAERAERTATPSYERLADGSFQWSIGNGALSQQLLFEKGQFSCRSLLNRRTGREWIHPVETSDEFLVEISGSGTTSITLTGKGQWQYQSHFMKSADGSWGELIVDLKCTQLPMSIRRQYWWHETLPVIRQRLSLKNEGTDNLVVHRADTFRLHVSPVPEALELAWMNNFCRGMKPNPGNPIHHCSIDDNSQQFIRTGPYSPDCGWFSLTALQQREGLTGGWEWSGPMVVGFGDMQEPCLIHGGLDPEGMAETLAPGKTFEAPMGWYGFFEGDLDQAASLSHDLVRGTFGPTLPKQAFPWVGYCTWACSMDKDSPFNEKDSHPWFPSQQNLLSQVEAAAELGCDLFLWDYGWFPQVGDWWCDPKRFPQGPRPIVQAVKSQRMKLGLWIGFGNANDTSRVIREHPDWLATYGGRPIPEKFFTRTGASVWNTRVVCLAHRPARQWVKQQLSRVIEEFELDWLKHDFDLMTICQAENHTHTPGDGRIAACAAFYEIMDFVRQRYPQVLCENWMNNSAVPDYGVLQRHHVQLIGDSYQAFSLRQMFYGHSQIFPPDRQHRYLRLEDSEGEFKNMLRSGTVGGPWTLLSDPRRLNTEQIRVLKKEVLAYKGYRHILAHATVYRLLGRPHPRAWDGVELYDRNGGEGIVYVFRNSHPEPRQLVTLKGLEENTSYQLKSLDTNQTKTLTGRKLMTTGIPVELDHPNTSEVIVIARL